MESRGNDINLDRAKKTAYHFSQFARARMEVYSTINSHMCTNRQRSHSLTFRRHREFWKFPPPCVPEPLLTLLLPKKTKPNPLSTAGRRTAAAAAAETAGEKRCRE